MIALETDYVTVVEDRPIRSAEYSLPLLAKTDPSCSSVSLQQLSYLSSLLTVVEIVATGAFVAILVNCCIFEMAVLLKQQTTKLSKNTWYVSEMDFT